MHSIVLARLGKTRLPIPGADPWYAEPTDPALGVMTDFRERPSVTVSENATIDAALEHMKHTGVRCAFAVDDEPHTVTGLITAYDIMGEAPIRHMRTQRVERRSVLVSDLMQRTADWLVADIRDIERATVGDIDALFDRSGVTHIPVMEPGGSGERRLRGLLSGAKVRRLLSRHRDIDAHRRSRDAG